MKIKLDARFLGDRIVAHKYLKDKLRFPDHYGNNLDALADCLGELKSPEYTVIYTAQTGNYYGKILAVLQETGTVKEYTGEEETWQQN